MAAKKGKKKAAATDDPNSRIVCRNRRARHEYDILDKIDCGLVLFGSEVKSIRNNKISIDEGYAKVVDGEVWLFNVDIAEYPQATVWNHEPRRKRKLLLRRREIRKFAESGQQDGLTLVPLSVMFRRGFVKLQLGLAKGRKLHDKRQKLKEKADRREIRAESR